MAKLTRTPAPLTVDPIVEDLEKGDNHFSLVPYAGLGILAYPSSVV